MSTSPNLRRMVFLALARPGLWPALVRAGWRFRRARWYRRAPFLPLPPEEYLTWRYHTAYGATGQPQPHELKRYLAWSTRMARRDTEG